MTSATLTSPVHRDAAAPRVARSSRSRQRSYVRTLVVVDATVICLGVAGGYLARFRGEQAFGSEIPYGVVAAGLVVAWLLSLRLMRCYDTRVLGYGADEYRRVAGGSLRLAGAVAIVGYLVNVGVARGFLGISFLAGTAGLVAARFVIRKRLHRQRSKGGGWSRSVVVVGDGAHVLELVRQLQREPYAGFRVVGACLPEPLVTPEPQRLGGVPIVGSFRTVIDATLANGADTIAVTGAGELTAARLRRLGWQLEGTGIDLVLAPALTDVAGPRIHTQPVAGLPLIHVEAPEFRGGRKVFKGLVDRAIALFALILLSPLIVVLSIAVLVDTGRPVFFRQVRVGKGAREFGVFKFRTMVVNADAMLDHLAGHNESDGLLFKMRRDPRVTRVGRFLRSWSLDEVPQLFNVLFGQMSLVGPRPPLPKEVAHYDGDIARRLLVKPGITGLWQVSGRSDLSFEDGIRLDLYYVENWSLAADLAILWKTFGAVMGRRGAY